MNMKYTMEQIDGAIAYAAKRTQAEAAKKYGTSQGNIGRWILNRDNYQKLWDEHEQIKTRNKNVIKDYLDGVVLTSIYIEYSIRPGALVKILSDNGVKPNRNTGRRRNRKIDSWSMPSKDGRERKPFEARRCTKCKRAFDRGGYLPDTFTTVKLEEGKCNGCNSAGVIDESA